MKLTCSIDEIDRLRPEMVKQILVCCDVLGSMTAWNISKFPVIGGIIFQYPVKFSILIC